MNHLIVSINQSIIYRTFAMVKKSMTKVATLTEMQLIAVIRTTREGIHQYSTVIFRSGLTNEEYSEHFGHHLGWFTMGIKGTKGVDGKSESDDRHCAWTAIQIHLFFYYATTYFLLQTSVHTKFIFRHRKRHSHFWSCESYQFSPSIIYNLFELCALLNAFLIYHWFLSSVHFLPSFPHLPSLTPTNPNILTAGLIPP